MSPGDPTIAQAFLGGHLERKPPRARHRGLNGVFLRFEEDHVKLRKKQEDQDSVRARGETQALHSGFHPSVIHDEMSDKQRCPGQQARDHGQADPLGLVIASRQPTRAESGPRTQQRQEDIVAKCGVGEHGVLAAKRHDGVGRLRDVSARRESEPMNSAERHLHENQGAREEAVPRAAQEARALDGAKDSNHARGFGEDRGADGGEEQRGTHEAQLTRKVRGRAQRQQRRGEPKEQREERKGAERQVRRLDHVRAAQPHEHAQHEDRHQLPRAAHAQ